jgi:hypothetical protein
MVIKLIVAETHLAALLSVLNTLNYVKIEEVKANTDYSVNVVEELELPYHRIEIDSNLSETNYNTRPLIAQSNAFEFWQDEKEDLYEEYIKK